MKLIALTLHPLPNRLLVWLGRRRAPLGECVADDAWREEIRRCQERPPGPRPLHPLLMAAAGTTSARAPTRQLGMLIAAAQAGDELAFRRLLRRHQRLLEQQAGRFYLPGGDGDDVLQEARLGFTKAVRAYRPERGASFPSFARRCVARQLATALTAATRGKHGSLNEAARGADAQRACERYPAGRSPPIMRSPTSC
jgi:Sigma-70 region 2